MDFLNKKGGEKMKYFKKLEGERIYLSPRSCEDAELFTKWFNDFNVTDYVNRSSMITTLQAEKEWLQNHCDDEASFVIIEKETENMIGTISLEKINHLHRTATLGIFIGNQEARHKGYGTEAIHLILEYGFRYLNLNNIALDVLEWNEAAIHCYQKCGFKEYGRRRKCIFLDGTYYDRISMDILAEELKGEYIKNKRKL